ncbi:MAG: hypothetical protein ACXVMS_08075 [Flavisolibacter sp.]
MSYNISAYMIYLALMVFIIVYVGRYFYTNGRIFILSLLNHDIKLADQINKLLLLAYYLFNIGYAFTTVRHWQKVSNMETLFSSLATNMGKLILILAFTHYLNMLTIYYLSKSKPYTITNKSFHV